jgi:hypothetical protein
MTGRFGASLCALVLVVAACGSSSSSAAPGSMAPGASSAPEASTDANPPSMAAAGGGSCSVDITGATQKSWKSPQNIGTLLVGYWLSASDRDMLSMTDTEAALIFNCQSDSGSVSFTLTNGTTTAQFPMAPADYVIAPSASTGDPGQITIIVSLKDDNLWRVAEPGTFKVTTFGGGKFAGTFQVKLTSSVGDASVTGLFDLGCTGSACS